MIPCVYAKDGVQFTKIAPAGFRMIAAIWNASQVLGVDLTITSACDGEHSGPDDPHHKGEAYDIRTHGIADRQGLLTHLQAILGQDMFFCWIEAEGQENEHIHIQRKKGTTYPPAAEAPSQSPQTPEP